MLKKKMLAAGLAALMLATAFTGCAGKESGKRGDSSIPVENNCYETGFPIAKDPVKLTVMVKDDSNGKCDYDNLPITKWIKDEMNIEIEWLSVPGGWEVNNQATLAFASGNMPDILMGMAPLGYSFYWDYILEGKVQDLTPYIEKYGKNIVKMFADEPLSEYLCTGYDGKVYMLPLVMTNDENAGSNATGRFASTLYINQTWLDNLGLSMPTTTAEFKNVLKAFKANDPNGNGIADEVPFELQEDLPSGLYGPFGISIYEDKWYLAEDETVHFAPVEDNYRRALAYYRDLYQEGLIGKDFYNQSITDIAKKIDGTVSTVGAFACTFGSATNYISAERAEEYVVVPPLSDELGNCTWTNQQTETCWPEWFVVTSNCKYPEIAVRFADYFYSLEGSYTAMYGPEGEENLWHFNDEGKVVFTPKENLSLEKFQYTPGYPLPHWSGTAYWSAEAPADESKMTAVEKIEKRNNERRLELYNPVVPKKSLPKIKMSLTDMKEASLLSRDIDDYTWRKNFLLGEASLENEWDAYIANMKKLGVDDLIQIYQNSYDSYVEWLNQ